MTTTSTEPLDSPPPSITELTSALALAARYLEHPDVVAIPFALPAESVAERIRALLARIPR